jgi:hypothetical protein
MDHLEYRPKDFEERCWDAEAEVVRLREENESLKKDAERYRWLRENAMLRDPYDMGYGPSSWNWTIELETGKSGGRTPPNSTPTFDETVDAEMAKY